MDSSSSLAIAELWGIGEADPLVLGAVLATVAVCALVYICSGRFGRRKRRKAGE